jgi:hypothetical protein
MGYSQEPNPSKFHRVLSRARWSTWQMRRLLLGLLVDTFVPEGQALVLLVDETLERRAGKKIGYKGWFRDAVRSVGDKVAVSLGIRWCCVCLLVSVPWASRAWALRLSQLQPAPLSPVGLARVGPAVSGGAGALGEDLQAVGQNPSQRGVVDRVFDSEGAGVVS